MLQRVSSCDQNKAFFVKVSQQVVIHHRQRSGAETQTQTWLAGCDSLTLWVYYFTHLRGRLCSKLRSRINSSHMKHTINILYTVHHFWWEPHRDCNWIFCWSCHIMCMNMEAEKKNTANNTNVFLMDEDALKMLGANYTHFFHTEWKSNGVFVLLNASKHQLTKRLITHRHKMLQLVIRPASVLKAWNHFWHLHCANLWQTKLEPTQKDTWSTIQRNKRDGWTRM